VRARPHLATLLIGLNDVGRGAFAPTPCARPAARVAALRGCGATVLLGRLHDPGTHLPLPPGCATAVRARVAVVNAAVDDAVRAARDGAAATCTCSTWRACRALRSRRPGRSTACTRTPRARASWPRGGRGAGRAGLPVGPVRAEPLPARAPGAAGRAVVDGPARAALAGAHVRDVRSRAGGAGA
jgi:hypothetical protein